MGSFARVSTTIRLTPGLWRIHTSGRRGRLAWAALPIFAPAAEAQPDLSWLIYRADLTTLTAVELRLTGDALAYRDPRGQRKSLPRDQVAAILRVDSAATFLEHGQATPMPPAPDLEPGEQAAPGAPPETPMASLIGLTDGQAYRGRVGAQASSKPDAVVWDTPLFGSLILDLDRLSWLRVDDDVALPAPATSDALLLANGDRLEGFVEHLQPTIRVAPPTGNAVELSPAQVASLRFANPESRPTGPRVWLSDGTVADLASLGTEKPIAGGERFTVRLASGQAADVPPDQLLAARLIPGVLLPLADLECRVEPPEGRPWTPPLRRGARAVPLGLVDIELPGPMRVSWTLPRGVTRLSLTAELPLDARLWGDATLTIALGGPLASVHLSSAEPSHDLTLDLPAPERADRTLVVSLDEGRFGPIQDRAVLKRAVLATAPVPR